MNDTKNFHCMKILFFVFLIILWCCSSPTENHKVFSSDLSEPSKSFSYTYNPETDEYIEYPDTIIKGIYGDIKFVNTCQSTKLEKIMDLKYSIDINNIFKISNDGSKVYYMLASHKDKNPGLKSGLHYACVDFFPDTISLSSSKNIVIYLIEESVLFPSARYCFATDKHFIFTQQWLSDFFVDVRKVQTLILDYPSENPTEVDWAFTFKSNILTDADVWIQKPGNTDIVAYDILTLKHHTIHR